MLGNCDKCGESDCECRGDDETSKTGTTITKETDVCSFGCLYYLVSTSTYLVCLMRELAQIFFDTYPFQGKDEYHVFRLVARGVRPDRLSDPIIEDNIWDIIQRSWVNKPSERPTMQQIVKSLANATREASGRDVIQIRLKSDPSEHLTKAPTASPSVPALSFSATPPSSAASASASSQVFRPLLASLNEVPYAVFEASTHRD